VRGIHVLGYGCRDDGKSGPAASGPSASNYQRAPWRDGAKFQASDVIGPGDHIRPRRIRFASPNRRTEAMIDGSEAIADWPGAGKNALLNASSGRHLGVGAPWRGATGIGHTRCTAGMV